MSFSELLKQKKINHDAIVNKYKLLKKNKPLWLIDLKDEKVLKLLLNWLEKLPSNFIVLHHHWRKPSINSQNIFITSEQLDSVWFDFVVCDDCNDNLSDYIKKLVVPIINEDNHMSSILKEFNAIKNEWNSYLYKDKDEWSIFYALVRYLENYKFSFDNKNLVKNLFEI